MVRLSLILAGEHIVKIVAATTKGLETSRTCKLVVLPAEGDPSLADTLNPFEFTYTEANKAIVDERGGMLLVGYGYKLTKVTFSK